MNPVLWSLVVSAMGIIATVVGIFGIIKYPHSVSIRLFSTLMINMTAVAHFMWSVPLQKLAWLFIALTWWFIFFMVVRTDRVVRNVKRQRKALDRTKEVIKLMDESFARFNQRMKDGITTDESTKQFEEEIRVLSAEHHQLFADHLNPTDRLRD